MAVEIKHGHYTHDDGEKYTEFWIELPSGAVLGLGRIDHHWSECYPGALADAVAKKKAEIKATLAELKGVL